MSDDKTSKKKAQALALTISAVEKEFGKGSIMRLKDGQPMHTEVPSIPTGSLGLDIALGVGGYPRGRVIEVYGPESSGKTTLTLHAIASVQRQGGIAAFIDAEHALDLSYARKLGVDTEELLISQPDFGEQALEIADMLIRSGTVDLIVIDSVAALVPKAELEGDMGDSHVGLQARLMSQALRKLTGSLNKSRCAMFFINQLRMKIGVMFGSPETTTGGNALKFYSSVRMRVARIGAIKEAGGAGRDPQVVGNRTRVKIVKNKLAPPFREHEFDILYGKGISLSGDVLDLAVDLGVVDKSGSWFSFNGERLGQGREKVRLHLENNPELLRRIENIVRAKNDLPIIGGISPEEAPTEGPDEAASADAAKSDGPKSDGPKSDGKAKPEGKTKPNGKAKANGKARAQA